MEITAGTRLGSYEIISRVGAGGVGEVFRARDARLGRDVAIKVIPATFASHADWLRRFEQNRRREPPGENFLLLESTPGPKDLLLHVILGWQ